MRVCARTCACEVHKCSTCHSSFRGSYLGEQGHLAELALLRGRRISVATRCRFDSRYPLACRDMTPCHCARRIKHSKQRASSSLASFLRRKKNFLFSFTFSSVTKGINMAEALSLEGMCGIGAAMHVRLISPQSMRHMMSPQEARKCSRAHGSGNISDKHGHRIVDIFIYFPFLRSPLYQRTQAHRAALLAEHAHPLTYETICFWRRQR